MTMVRIQSLPMRMVNTIEANPEKQISRIKNQSDDMIVSDGDFQALLLFEVVENELEIESSQEHPQLMEHHSVPTGLGGMVQAIFILPKNTISDVLSGSDQVDVVTWKSMGTTNNASRQVLSEGILNRQDTASHFMQNFRGTLSGQGMLPNYQSGTFGNQHQIIVNGNTSLPPEGAVHLVGIITDPSDPLNSKVVREQIKLPDKWVSHDFSSVNLNNQKVVFVPSVSSALSTAWNTGQPIIQNTSSLQIVPAVLQQLSSASAAGSVRAIEVQLMPKNLGVITIKISHIGQKLSVAIETRNMETQNLLRSETLAISTALHRAGLNLEEITIKHNPNLDPIQDSPKELRSANNRTENGRDSWNGNQTNDNNHGENPRQTDDFRPTNSTSDRPDKPQYTGVGEQRSGIYL